MAWENHYAHLMTGSNLEISAYSAFRKGLIFQNNGANNMYLAFGRAAYGDGNDFVLAPGGWWVLDAACPSERIAAKGTAGDLLSVLETFN